MTNERAVEILNLDLDILGQYGGETAEAYKMAIQALEAQPSEDCISRQAVLDTIGNVPDHNDGMVFEALSHAQRDVALLPSVTPRRDLALTSQDCISREEIKEFINTMLTSNEEMGSIATNEGRWVEEKMYLHGVEILEGLSEYVNDLPPVKPTYTDEEIDKAQAVEQAYVDKMVELAVEEAKRPKGKWIEVEVRNVYATLKCSVCGRVIEPIFDFCKYSYEDIKRSYPYCHCGAEMSGGGEE